MSNAREQFYNIRNQLDKQKDYNNEIGQLAAENYLSLIPDLRNKVVLDAGLGTGWLTKHFGNLNPKYIWGIDISSDRVNEIESYFQTTNIPHAFISGSVEDLSAIPSDSVDFINCRDVIEHLKYPEKCLGEFKRVLKQGGKLLLQTPNDLIHTTYKIEHYIASILALVATGKEHIYRDDDPFLFQDSEKLSSDQMLIAEQIKTEGIHEHEYQWQPEELMQYILKFDFKIMELSGSPLCCAVFYQMGNKMQWLTPFYISFIRSHQYQVLLEALKAEHERSSISDIPANYVISDDLILLAEK